METITLGDFLGGRRRWPPLLGAGGTAAPKRFSAGSCFQPHTKALPTGVLPLADGGHAVGKSHESCEVMEVYSCDLKQKRELPVSGTFPLILREISLSVGKGERVMWPQWLR